MSDMKDVFISYRRDGGATVARMLAELLKARNVSVFFDAETLKGGDFGQQIAKHLNDCENVVLVVTPNLFDRCSNENDWVRKELETALQTRAGNIIPVFVNGANSIPNGLPVSIAKISTYNGITFKHDNFDEAFEDLLAEIKKPLDTLIDTWLNFPDGERYDLEFLKMHIDHFYGMGFVSDEQFNQLVRVVFEHYRSVVKRKSFDDVDDFEELFVGYRLEYLKELCEDLKIDKSGRQESVIERLFNYTNGEKELVSEQSEACRFDQFTKSLFRECDGKRAVKERIIRSFDVEETLSASEIVKSAYYSGSSADFFDQMKFRKDELDAIALRLFDGEPQMKADQINTICQYLEYEFDVEHEAEE